LNQFEGKNSGIEGRIKGKSFPTKSLKSIYILEILFLIGARKGAKVKKRTILALLAIPTLVLLTSCSNSGGSSNSASSDTTAQTSVFSTKVRDSGAVGTMCLSLSGGPVCTVDVVMKNTGNDAASFEYSAKAFDDQGRSYLPQNDPSDPNVIAEGTVSMNPGEELDWALEFAVTPGTHLTKLNVYDAGKLINTLPLDIQADQ
jgi:hypothetical protein